MNLLSSIKNYKIGLQEILMSQIFENLCFVNLSTVSKIDAIFLLAKITKLPSANTIISIMCKTCPFFAALCISQRLGRTNLLWSYHLPKLFFHACFARVCYSLSVLQMDFQSVSAD